MGCGLLLYNDCFYMFRLMFLTFFQEFRGTAEQNTICTKVHSLITIPLIVLAILATIGGMICLETVG
jgi:NADH-quinone oxidoreductase subunit L